MFCSVDVKINDTDTSVVIDSSLPNTFELNYFAPKLHVSNIDMKII